MPESYSLTPDPNPPSGGGQRPPQTPPIVINNIPPKKPWLGSTIVRTLLVLSILGNIALFGMYRTYYPGVSSNEQFVSGKQFASAKIAIIPVEGMITTESVKSARGELKKAMKDDDVKAIVLAVNSPGGTISGSDELYHTITEFKQKTQRPIVVSMEGLATSGAYYISMPADEIFAERSCITGSIGVIVNLMSFEKLLKDWGIQPEVIKSGSMKDSGSPFRTMTPEEREEWQGLVTAMFDQFLGVILKHRTEKIGGEEKLRKIANGQVFIAEEAKKLGLIDAIGYRDDAIESAKKLAGVGEEVRIITYQRPFGGWLDVIQSKRQSSVLPNWTQLADLRMPGIWLLPGSMFTAGP
ncbi:Putative signal peptide peptidase SppA [Planctomycetes bacterium Pan216]|uniref:Signal peptide peptidase SppA n=1 Tax=Kolteria novifilia TaxID=2527975 RepID=A0A518B240_9BACT|nr:Putative signal peptide peptidase SppA [Planctomycetes bacterium Pan216]